MPLFQNQSKCKTLLMKMSSAHTFILMQIKVIFYKNGFAINKSISFIFSFILGWATAELIMTRLVPLWVGARGVEFDWKYIQMSFDANVSLVSDSHFITGTNLCITLGKVLFWLFDKDTCMSNHKKT